MCGPELGSPHQSHTAIANLGLRAEPHFKSNTPTPKTSRYKRGNRTVSIDRHVHFDRVHNGQNVHVHHLSRETCDLDDPCSCLRILASPQLSPRVNTTELSTICTKKTRSRTLSCDRTLLKTSTNSSTTSNTDVDRVHNGVNARVHQPLRDHRVLDDPCPCG